MINYSTISEQNLCKLHSEDEMLTEEKQLLQCTLQNLLQKNAAYQVIINFVATLLLSTYCSEANLMTDMKQRNVYSHFY